MTHRKKSRRPVNNGKSWSAEEDEIVMKSIDEGYTHGQVADLLDRTRGAVESRHCTLNQIRSRESSPGAAGETPPAPPLVSPWMDDPVPVRLYIAGKIEAGGFRESIVDGLMSDNDASMEWPVLRRAVLDAFDYTGPFMVGCNHSPEGCMGDHGQVECDMSYEHAQIARRCRQAIRRSDAVFAWIDSTDCFGTLVELGYAMSIGLPIFIAGPKYFGEMWFAYECCAVGRDGTCPSIRRCIIGAVSAYWALSEFAPLIRASVKRWRSDK